MFSAIKICDLNNVYYSTHHFKPTHNPPFSKEPMQHRRACLRHSGQALNFTARSPTPLSALAYATQRKPSTSSNTRNLPNYTGNFSTLYFRRFISTIHRILRSFISGQSFTIFRGSFRCFINPTFFRQFHPSHFFDGFARPFLMDDSALYFRWIKISVKLVHNDFI